MKYNRMPLKKLGITEKYGPRSGGTFHYGTDLGWFDYHGEEVYAMNDGVVDQVDVSTGKGNAGVYVWIKHSYNDTYDIWSRYCHLQEGSVCVSVGQTVSRGQKIALMGGTFGYDVHLHFEIWIVPKGWKFNWSDRSKYAKPCTDYVYAFPDQYIGSDADNKAIIRVLGSPVARDTSKDQIEVVGYQLRCRADAGTDKAVLGYIDFGIYNYDATKEANGYTWYHIPAGWIAGTKEDTKVYPKEQPIPPTPDPKDEKIKELEAEIAKKNLEIKDLESQNKALQEEIEKLNKEIEELKKHGDLKVFTAPKEGYYYIYLQEGECVYLKA